MELPDPDVMDMVTACARNILQAREIKNGLPEFQVGPTIYRGLWVVDGHFLLEAAQYLGHAGVAFRGIDALLRRAKPSGAIEQMEFHTKETGIALATLVRQCELMGDMTRLESLWPTIRRAVDYIQSLREASKARGADAPEYGLMPPSFGDGGLGGMRPEYTTALWTLVGLKEVAGAARRLGHIDDAERFQAAFDDLMRAFREHAARDMRTLPDGTPYLPMLKPGSGEHYRILDYPGTPEPWHRANPGTATWAFAHAIYPGEVFAPDDPLVQNFCHLLELLDDEEGVPAGTGWLPYRGLWNYAASFYAHVWLYAGRPDKAIDYLYAFANHATPTWVWREEQSFVHSQQGQKVGDMPHNWASAEFIRLVRHLLVFERGDVLELLSALPAEWLEPGRPLRLERTPTRFGPVSLRLHVDAAVHRARRDDGHGHIEVALDTGWPRRPARCVLHVPRAAETGIGEVAVNSQTVAVEAGGTVELPVVDRVTVKVSVHTS
jgi:GH15 family glucan-1,4-alpha-glucosidase